MTCNVTAAQFAAYLDNTSAELVDHVGTCGACQQRLEGSAPANRRGRGRNHAGGASRLDG